MSANSRKVSPLAWVPTLYFAMGLPFIIVNMVATLMFRGLGIDDARITLWTSLIILPWSLKPFWSPLILKILPVLKLVLNKIIKLLNGNMTKMVVILI